jgi:uncharacterized protein (DUF302 family)
VSGNNANVLLTRSTSGYAETTKRLIEAITSRGLTVFARIDHAAAASEVGLELAAEEVVIFGNPRAGTPLMQRDARIGVELPLRMLIWEDSEGALLGYNDPRELATRYDVDPHHSMLEMMSGLLGQLATEAAR